jgi:hypothetical protein
MSENNVDTAARVLGDPRAAAITDGYGELRTALDRIRLALQAATTGRVEGLLNAIESHATSKRWPHRRTADGIRVAHLLEVKPAESGTTKVQAKSVRSLNWDAVRPVLDSEHERLWGRANRLGPSKIGQELAAAIDELKGEASSAGHVQLRSVYQRMKNMRPKEPGRVASYYRDEFSADLSLVKQSEGANRRFEFAAARDPRLAFEIVEADGSLLRYGYIRKK